jgi:hypothetical protein
MLRILFKVRPSSVGLSYGPASKTRRLPLAL